MTSDEFFASFTRSAWRLETLPAYGTEDSDPSFARYLELGHLPPLEQRPRAQAWLAAVRQVTMEGRRMGRVHVLGRPLSSYLVYELATYPENAAAGETIGIADADTHPELAGLDRDFWLLDDELVLVMDYDSHGCFQQLTPTRDRQWVTRARRQRDLAVACSVPLADFLASA